MSIMTAPGKAGVKQTSLDKPNSTVILTLSHFTVILRLSHFTVILRNEVTKDLVG